MPMTKPVFSPVLKGNVPFTFLRWNMLDEYNWKINNNNVANQLHLVYRIQQIPEESKVVVGGMDLGL